MGVMSATIFVYSSCKTEEAENPIARNLKASSVLNSPIYFLISSVSALKFQATRSRVKTPRISTSPGSTGLICFYSGPTVYLIAQERITLPLGFKMKLPENTFGLLKETPEHARQGVNVVGGIVAKVSLSDFIFIYAYQDFVNVLVG